MHRTFLVEYSECFAPSEAIIWSYYKECGVCSQTVNCTRHAKLLHRLPQRAQQVCASSALAQEAHEKLSFWYDAAEEHVDALQCLSSRTSVMIHCP